MCDFTNNNAATSGDNLYGPRVNKQTFIDWAWDAFDFDKGDWDNGRGYERVWDVTLPLNRTLGGIWCLVYSAGGSPDSNISGPNILKWGWRYAQNCIDELDAECGSGSIAHTQWGPIIDNYTELYRPFFTQAVSLRAGTLVHEARHADGCGHDAGNNDSSWEYNGAWRWQVCWLAWFASSGQFTTSALKTLARQRANQILANNFSKPPGFTV